MVQIAVQNVLKGKIVVTGHVNNAKITSHVKLANKALNWTKS